MRERSPSFPFWRSLHEERASAVGSLCGQRAALLTEADIATSAGIVAAPAGRFVVFWPDETLSDGAAEVGSDEYFDQENEPPWDCWIWYECGDKRSSDGYRNAVWQPATGRRDGWIESRYPNSAFLVAWVTAMLDERVAHGLWANSEGCVDWLDHLDVPFTRALRSAGMLGPLPR